MNGRYADARDRYRQLAENGQSPHTLVVACSDSRAAPELIFDAGPGELFVIRNVANMVPPYEPDGHFHSTSAALEFAVQVLKVTDIVVMGHGRCGGIRAALDPNAEPLSPGDFIGRWMSLVKPAAEQIQSNDVMTARPPNGRRRWSASPFAIRSAISEAFPTSRRSRKRGNFISTAPGSTFRPVNSGSWTPRHATSFVPKSKDAPVYQFFKDCC